MDILELRELCAFLNFKYLLEIKTTDKSKELLSSHRLAKDSEDDFNLAHVVLIFILI